MLIVSQDKTQIINFDNIEKIETILNEVVVFYKGTELAGTNGTESIGLYRTEERAKEVLKEITQRYVHIPYKKYGNDYIKQNQIYEMPKE